jgi:hypothetical protein
VREFYWHRAGSAFYAVVEGRIEAVLYPMQNYGHGDASDVDIGAAVVDRLYPRPDYAEPPPQWWLALAELPDDARPLSRWTGQQPGAPLAAILAGAAGVVRARVEGRLPAAPPLDSEAPEE